MLSSEGGGGGGGGGGLVHILFTVLKINILYGHVLTIHDDDYIHVIQ